MKRTNCVRSVNAVLACASCPGDDAGGSLRSAGVVTPSIVPQATRLTTMRLLALLHGLGEDSAKLARPGDRASPGFRAVAPWLRGMRPARTEEFGVEGAADDVLALLNQYGVEQMSIVGVSLGAMVALDAAIRAPEAVSHLVLASGQVNTPFGDADATVGVQPDSR